MRDDVVVVRLVTEAVAVDVRALGLLRIGLFDLLVGVLGVDRVGRLAVLGVGLFDLHVGLVLDHPLGGSEALAAGGDDDGSDQGEQDVETKHWAPHLGLMSQTSNCLCRFPILTGSHLFRDANRQGIELRR